MITSLVRFWAFEGKRSPNVHGYITKKMSYRGSTVPFTTPDTPNPRHVKPQTHQTPDTSNLRHIKPQIKNMGLQTTQQIKIPFHILIEILFENLKINRIFN